MANAHISERLSFLTQVHTAWDGTEQRLCLRRLPRVGVSYDFSGMDAAQSAYLRQLIGKAESGAVDFPLWHAESELEEDLAAGSRAVPVPPRFLWSYRNIGAFLMFTGDMEANTAHRLKSLSADGLLHAGDKLERDYRGRLARVMPVARCALAQDNGFSNETDTVTEMTLALDLLAEQNAPALFPARFDAAHDEPIDEEAMPLHGLPAFIGPDEVFRFGHMYAGDFKAQYSKAMSRVDFDSGVFRLDARSSEAAETRELAVALRGRPMINNLERFFTRHRGRWKSFLAPTLTDDLALAADAAPGDATLAVASPVMWKYLGKSRRRRRLALFLRDGSVLMVDVGAFTRADDGSHGVLVLDAPMPRRVDAVDVWRASFMQRVRFASDDLLVDYETTEAATCTVTLVETDS